MLDQGFFGIGIDLGMEQIVEHFLAIVAFGVENAQKIALGDHHGACELAAVKPHDLTDPRIHLVNTGQDAFVPLDLQHGCCPLGGGAAAPLFGALVFGTAAHGAKPAVLQKAEFDIGRGFGIGVIRAEGFARAAILSAAGLTVKRIGDRIENTGLSRTGFACQQKDPAAKALEIHHRAVTEGAKGRQLQTNGLHSSTSPSSSFFITARRASSGGLPLWRS